MKNTKRIPMEHGGFWEQRIDNNEAKYRLNDTDKEIVLDILKVLDMELSDMGTQISAAIDRANEKLSKIGKGIPNHPALLFSSISFSAKLMEEADAREAEQIVERPYSEERGARVRELMLHKSMDLTLAASNIPKSHIAEYIYRLIPDVLPQRIELAIRLLEEHGDDIEKVLVQGEA